MDSARIRSRRPSSQRHLGSPQRIPILEIQPAALHASSWQIHAHKAGLTVLDVGELASQRVVQLWLELVHWC